MVKKIQTKNLSDQQFMPKFRKLGIQNFYGYYCWNLLTIPNEKIPETSLKVELHINEKEIFIGKRIWDKIRFSFMRKRTGTFICCIVPKIQYLQITRKII
jgi:hypothetical protein